jgi:arsenite methyltransferase
MADPFQNVSAAGAAFIETFAKGLEARAADPSIVPMIEAYLNDIDWRDVHRAIEIGSGTGAISRMIADRAPGAEVIGFEPSPEFVSYAENLKGDRPNLTFETGDGAALRYASATFNLAAMHTVLSHVTEPRALLAEAFRVLAPGGMLVVFDCDFSKSSLANARFDPMHTMAQHFYENYVTDQFLIGKLRRMCQEAGFVVREFRVGSRLRTEGQLMSVAIRLSGDQMVEAGIIGRPLADALLAEYDRRLEEGVLYGHQVYATLIASKPVIE